MNAGTKLNCSSEHFLIKQTAAHTKRSNDYFGNNHLKTAGRYFSLEPLLARSLAFGFSIFIITPSLVGHCIVDK